MDHHKDAYLKVYFETWNTLQANYFLSFLNREDRTVLKARLTRRAGV
jgi:hypothetical protein